MANSLLQARLNNFSGRYPGLGKRIHKCMGLKDQIDIKPPDWCLLPFEVWHSITVAYSIHQGGHDRIISMKDESLYQEALEVMMLASWRYTMGAYEFDPDLFHELVKTPYKGLLPEDILLTLPEWTLFIRTPAYRMGNDVLYGFWVGVHVFADETSLCILMLFENHDRQRFAKIPLTGESRTLDELTDILVESWTEKDRQFGKRPFKALFNLVLFLCTEHPEEPFEPGVSIGVKPQLRKVKGGRRLFMTSGIKTYKPGTALGAQLRSYRGSTGMGPNQRAYHIRRAHWHTYWTGKKGAKKANVRWLPPIPVNPELKSADEQ